MKANLKALCLLLAVSVGACSVFSCAKKGGNESVPESASEKESVSLPDTPTQSVADAVKILESGPYKSDAIISDFGLSDGSQVGVDDSGREKELYPTKADEAFLSSNVFALDDYTGTDGEKTDALLAAAKAASVSGAVKIKLPGRAVTLTKPLEFSGFDGLYVEGEDGAELLFDCSAAGWFKGVTVSGCKDVHFNGFSVDYRVLPAIVGYVQSANTETNSVTLSVPESMHETVDAYRQNPALCRSIRSVIQYNRFTDGPEENGILLIESQGMVENWNFSDDYILTITFKSSYSFDAPVKNTPISVAFTMYDAAGFTFSGCENVYVDGVNLYSCPGMAFVVSETTGFYANRFSAVLRNEDRRMTATADGYHIVSCLGEVSVTNSIIENTHDDALNIKSGYWYTLSDYNSSERKFTVSKKTGANLLSETGDTIEFYDSSSFELLGVFTVTGVEGNASSMTISVKERISGNVDWSRAMMTNVSKVAKFTFRNNIVRNKRNRGVLIQVRDAVISDNAFVNVGHGSMQIASSLDIYNETTVPRNITVKNNKFINNGYLLSEGLRGDISCFAIGSEAVVAPAGTVKDITIENNYFSNSGNASISLRGVGESTVKDNLFYNSARVFAYDSLECCIELNNCAGVTIEGNYNYNTNDSDTFSGIVTAGMTKESDILLSGNINLKFQVIEGNVVNTNVSRIPVGTVTVDGNIAEWDSIGSVVEMDGSSLTTGDEILYDDYKDVFRVLSCKIAWSDEGIYLAFDVYDDKLDFKTIANFWEGDCFEFFFSTITDMPNADLQLYKNEGDVLQLSVVPSWSTPYTFSEVRTNERIVAGKSMISVGVILRENGYSGEVFLPFSLLTDAEKAIGEGKSIAMAFVFMDSDRDDIGRKRIQVANVPHFVETYKTKTAKMPTFTFVE